MNPTNALLHALRERGGFATEAELKTVKPKLKDLFKASVDIVDHGHAEWVESESGTQELRLTDACLEMMADTPWKFTADELRAAIDRGDDLCGRLIYVKRG